MRSTWQRRDPALAAKGARYLATLARRRIPLLYSTVLRRVARDGGLRATLRGPSSERDFSADVVLLGAGFLPSHEVLRALGAEIGTTRSEASSCRYATPTR